MNAYRLAAAALILGAGISQAGFFNQGIGSAMYYGPYTGGHIYSYNVAYGYGLSFSPSDSWRRDPLAYPAGIYPYRPYGRPILYRAFPIYPDNPPISVPGPDGLPVLRTPAPSGTPLLRPVPADGRCGTIRVIAPAGAKVWVEKEALAGGEYRTPALGAGVMKIYSIRAQWTDKDGTREQFRAVGVKAGETAQVDFTSAP